MTDESSQPCHEDELDDHACSGGGSSEDNPTPPPSMMIRNYDKSDNEDQ